MIWKAFFYRYVSTHTIRPYSIGFEQFGCHGVTRIAQALDNRYNKTLTELS